MALGTCRECEAEVSTEADSCPQCGVPEPVKTSKEERRFPPGPAPHGGPWDDWARWKLRSENPDAVVQALIRHGMELDHAQEEVKRQQNVIEAHRRRAERKERYGGHDVTPGSWTGVVGGLGLLLILAGVGWALYGLTTWTLGSGLLADTVGLWAWILYYGFPGLGAASVGMWLLAPGLIREQD